MAKVVKHENLKTYFGKEDHLQVAQSRSFAALVFELLSERVPSERELKAFELILNLSIDHGPGTPSATKVIEAAKTDKTISEAVAEGILQINDVHGGAIEPVMGILYRIKRGELGAKEVIEDCLKQGKRLPGFGHRLYKDVDPRAQLILQKLKEAGMGKPYLSIAQGLETELERQTGKKLPLNIDGAIAVVLCNFGWDPKLGKAVFIIARTPGLCGQYFSNS